MNSYKIIEFPHFSDSRGETVPFELDENIPFEVKRVYIVTGNKDEVRGGHAHRTEHEVFVCVSGSVKTWVHDGEKGEEIMLDRRNKGIYIPTDCWHEFYEFSADAVLLALSSTHYDGRNDYIEDKEAFLKKEY